MSYSVAKKTPHYDGKFIMMWWDGEKFVTKYRARQTFTYKKQADSVAKKQQGVVKENV